MGARVVVFMLYLSLSYGTIYLLISKRFLRWNLKAPQVRAAILTAFALIIFVGTMLVGPLPMVVALLAFIDYVRSSEALSAQGSSSHMSSWRRIVSILIGLIGLTRQGLAVGLGYCFRPPLFTTVQDADASIRGDDPTEQAHADQAPSSPEPVLAGMMSSFKQGLTVGLASCFRQPVFIATQGALADGVASLTGYIRSLVRKSDSDDRAVTAQVPAGGEFSDARYEFDGSNLFFVLNGERIAKRGHPRTPEAGKWIPLRDDVGWQCLNC